MDNNDFVKSVLDQLQQENDEIDALLGPCFGPNGNYYLNLYGFSTINSTQFPEWDEIEICREWIRTFCSVGKSVNRDRTSYKLKRAVEEWVKMEGKSPDSISNGAFIGAAILEHYRADPVLKPGRVQTDPINAVFNLLLPVTEQDREKCCWVVATEKIKAKTIKVSS